MLSKSIYFYILSAQTAGIICHIYDRSIVPPFGVLEINAYLIIYNYKAEDFSGGERAYRAFCHEMAKQ